MQEKDFEKWIRSIITAQQAQEHDKKLREYHRERNKYLRKSPGQYWAGQQICKLSKDYDNNVAMENWIKQERKSEHMAQKTVVQMSSSRRHAEFVFTQAFGTKA